MHIYLVFPGVHRTPDRRHQPSPHLLWAPRAVGFFSPRWTTIPQQRPICQKPAHQGVNCTTVSAFPTVLSVLLHFWVGIFNSLGLCILLCSHDTAGRHALLQGRLAAGTGGPRSPASELAPRDQRRLLQRRAAASTERLSHLELPGLQGVWTWARGGEGSPSLCGPSPLLSQHFNEPRPRLPAAHAPHAGPSTRDTRALSVPYPLHRVPGAWAPPAHNSSGPWAQALTVTLTRGRRAPEKTVRG